MTATLPGWLAVWALKDATRAKPRHTDTILFTVKLLTFEFIIFYPIFRSRVDQKVRPMEKRTVVYLSKRGIGCPIVPRAFKKVAALGKSSRLAAMGGCM